MTSPAPAIAESARLRALLVGAGVCAVLALGLPWSGAAGGEYTPGTYLPGWCYHTTIAGFTTNCITPAWVFDDTTGAAGAAGAQTSARVFVVFVAIAAAMALLRHSRRWAIAATAAAGAGLLLGGLGAGSGQIAGIAGAALLILALRHARLLGGARVRTDMTQSSASALSARADHHGARQAAQPGPVR